ncbi:MAG TPA: biotin--[acetyl-CoA-carboxylase] ligase [Candidatus Marinimicrobia bacterium]|nr:biotin--[acetyl-CoA-carboxylase] ligase [Candidatus Neomarinimicrobiota bacterium]
MIFTNLIKTNLRTKQFGRDIEYYQRLESTNVEAWELIQNGEASHGMIVITDYQTQGKGRGGNSWFMSPSKGLALSLILLESIHLEKAGLIPLAAGVAMAKTLKNRGGSPTLKWPNDILFHGKKTGGILCESKISGKSVQSMVVGIGINVNETEIDFPDELKETATSLSIESGHTHQRELVAAIFITFFEQYWEMLQEFPEEIINDWTSLCGHLGRSITFNIKREKQIGIFKSINHKGEACITIGGDEKVYPSIILE